MGFKGFVRGAALGGAEQMEEEARKKKKRMEELAKLKKKNGKNGKNGQNGLPDSETLEDYVGLRNQFTNGPRRGIYGGI